MNAVGGLAVWLNRALRSRDGRCGGRGTMRPGNCLRAVTIACLAVLHWPAAGAQGADPGDIPDTFAVATDAFDYSKREVMIPMRDGVRLHTVIVIPKGAHDCPILLDRTPYDAKKATARADSGHVAAVLIPTYAELAAAGYIVAIQDVRGKHGSEGVYVMNRPLSGPLNPTSTDHSTDAYDTIDWLAKNVAESNGRIGTIGTSYDGFTALMSLVNPHPALKAVVPINPMVDGWRGDDWFHNGAFREQMADYIYRQTASKSSQLPWWSNRYDDYENFMHSSAERFGATQGLDQLPFWRRLIDHPAYDEFWKAQAVDRILAERGVSVATLLVHSLWDQEDIYGAPAVYRALRDGAGGAPVHLVLGPWYHTQSNGNGAALGPIRFDGDTSYWFRRNVLLPFLDAQLKTNAPRREIAPVTAFETGTNEWRRYDRWPISCSKGCGAGSRALYLRAGFRLSFDPPAAAETGFDEYVSDPAKPVTYRIPPIRPLRAADSTWREWLLDDQRFASSRPDVLAYSTDTLTEPVRISGQPVAHLVASTSGTDSDWVVKLIDVYPDEVPTQPELGGYQLALSMDILRGRYRDDPSHPMPVSSGKATPYLLTLPNVNHVFLPGHRIMIQIQSSWFPLYDRNPQTYVGNIFRAAPSDYVKATQRVYRSLRQPSFVELPVAPMP